LIAPIHSNYPNLPICPTHYVAGEQRSHRKKHGEAQRRKKGDFPEGWLPLNEMEELSHGVDRRVLDEHDIPIPIQRGDEERFLRGYTLMFVMLWTQLTRRSG
jgi:hypothetical protein